MYWTNIIYNIAPSAKKNSNNMKKALLIINLGTPDKPSYFSVFKYLRQFLMDGRVININPILRFLLVNLIICPTRSFSSTKIYKKVWDDKNGSPLLYNTEKLSKKLSKKLPEYDVHFAMRYQNPSIESEIEKILEKNPDEIIIFPLFPHYASATTGSVYEEVSRVLSKQWVVPKINFINQFYDNEKFIDAWVEKSSKFDIDSYDKIIFSYHGIPNSHVDNVYQDSICNDHDCESLITEKNKFCYKATTYETTKILASRLNINEDKYIVTFQSRLTNKWLSPFTDEVLESLPKEDNKNILVFSPAFTADCLETIIEIGYEYKELFTEAGGENLDYVESLNYSDAWVEKASKFDISSYDKIIFSYHGIPNSHVDNVYQDSICNDHDCESLLTEKNKFCYKATTYETTKILASRLNINEDKYIVTFQSRLTNKWLSPFTDEVLESLPKEGNKNILVFSPAFTADCLETIIEIGDEYKELFTEAGGENLDYVESLNYSDAWADAIIDIINKG